MWGRQIACIRLLSAQVNVMAWARASRTDCVTACTAGLTQVAKTHSLVEPHLPLHA